MVAPVSVLQAETVVFLRGENWEDEARRVLLQAEQERIIERRIVLRNVRNDLGEIGYCRLFDLDSEIHCGMSARTSSMDLASPG